MLPLINLGNLVLRERRRSVHAASMTGPSLGSGEIRSLTGLRGCAAVMVMLYHFSLSVPAGTLPLQDVLKNGYLFVDLFFVLSGFVMAYSQRRLFEAGYRVRNHVVYLLARLARIYPLYAVITIESVCSLVWRTPDIDAYAVTRVLFLNLALVQAWGLAPSLEGAAWSISTEWAAYLVFPLLLAVGVFSSNRVAIATAAISLCAILLVALVPVQVTLPGQGRVGPLDIYSSATALPVLRCIAEFSLGLIAFRVASSLAGRMKHWAGPLAWVVGASIAAALSYAGWDVCVVILFPVLIVALVPQTGAISGFLAGRAPYRLGQWSYSIYLIHDKFSHSVSGLSVWLASRIPMASEVTVVLMSGLVIAVGAGTYFVVELPLRELVMKPVRRFRPIIAEPGAIAPVSAAQSGIDGLGLVGK